MFNSLFGWTNSATYGSVIAYNLYWLVVIIAFASMRSYEKNGHWPFMKARAKDADDADFEKRGSESESDGVVGEASIEKGTAEGAQTSSNVREIEV